MHLQMSLADRAAVIGVILVQSRHRQSSARRFTSGHSGSSFPFIVLAASLIGLCFLWIFFGAPFAEKLRDVKSLNAALSAVTAAIVGVVLNLAIWFAIHSVFRETIPIRAFPLSFDAGVLSGQSAKNTRG
jgi:hypothetical protein